MPRKLLIILGSPRENGNTATLAAKAGQAASDAGAEVETAFLQGMDIHPCNACGHCHAHDGQCAIDDDMQALYPKVRQADALLLASPVYWFTVSAQTKLFMDRCYALLTDDGLRGKRIGIVLAYGAPDIFSSGGVNALRTFQDAYTFAGARIVGMVYGTGGEPDAIGTNQPLLESAAQLGKALVADQ